MRFFDEIISSLDFIEHSGIYPEFHVVSGQPNPETTVDGKKVILFCSNNYLGLSSNPEVMEAAKNAIDKFGTGAGGSRVLSGNLSLHELLEKEIAGFKNKEAAIVYSTGFQVGLGVIPALMKVFKIPSDDRKPSTEPVIFSDASNHASLIDGCRLSGSKVVIYKHCDTNDLREKLKKVGPESRKLIVTDGVFSMDGDLAPVDEIVPIAKEFKAAILLDDAHGTGVIGEGGTGTAEFFGVEKDIDMIMGTFSKALAGVGGFVTGPARLIKYLKVASRSYMFSAGLPASVSAAVLQSLRIIRRDKHLIRQVHSNAHYLRTKLIEVGFNILSSRSAIVPILIGEELLADRAAHFLLQNGIYASSVRWPAVEKGKAIIRFTVMSTHEKRHLDRLLQVSKEMKIKLKL